MHYVGIDLAWGDRAPSGLAVLDADGTLIHLSRATTDDTIVDALAPFVAGEIERVGLSDAELEELSRDGIIGTEMLMEEQLVKEKKRAAG